MNVIDFNPSPKVKKIARKLLAEARKNEPQITKDVGEIASFLKAEAIGLDNKFKSENSLTRKLSDYAKERNLPVEAVAERNNDVLRYTYSVSAEEFTNCFDSVKSCFKERNYKIGSIFNGWKLEGTLRDIGYRGINFTIISSQNQKFELQLHTESSFSLKTETHRLYEEFRNLKTSKARKNEIAGIMTEKALETVRPKGI